MGITKKSIGQNGATINQQGFIQRGRTPGGREAGSAEPAGAPAAQPESAADNGNVPENNENGSNNTEMVQNVPENPPIIPEGAYAPIKRYRSIFWYEGTLREIKAPKQWAEHLLFAQVMPTAIWEIFWDLYYHSE